MKKWPGLPDTIIWPALPDMDIEIPRRRHPHIDLRRYKYCPPDDPLLARGYRWRCLNCSAMGMDGDSAGAHAWKDSHNLKLYPYPAN